MSEYWDMVKDTMAENREYVAQNKQYWKDHPEVKGTSFWARAKDAIQNTEPSYDDKIEIAVGTKTLTGADFSSLYASSKVASVPSLDNNGNEINVDVLQSTCSYPTEMHSEELSCTSWEEYSNLPVDKRVAYEVVLLSKKGISNYSSDEQTKAKEYVDAMSDYKDFCDMNNISWSDVIQTASNELQLEVSDYQVIANDKSNVYEQTSGISAKAKSQSADAHNLLLACAPEDYQDQTAPGLDSSVSYEDTCNATYDDSLKARASGLLVVVHTMFSAIYDNLPHPITWAKSVFENLKNEGKNFAQNTEALMDDWDEQSDARLQEYKEISQQFQGIKEDVSNTGIGQAVEVAGDKISEEISDAYKDPSQSIQDVRNWAKDKYEQAEPYIDAAGNALKSTGEKVKGYADDFVEKWSSDSGSNGNESEDYQP